MQWPFGLRMFFNEFGDGKCFGFVRVRLGVSGAEFRGIGGMWVWWGVVGGGISGVGSNSGFAVSCGVCCVHVAVLGVVWWSAWRRAGRAMENSVTQKRVTQKSVTQKSVTQK